MIIQAVPVPAEGLAAAQLREAATAAQDDADLLLFDTRSQGRFGGSGATFPWELAADAAGDTPFLVAGGLGPENARQALAASGALGLDVSSGVESEPGVKDPQALRALFAALSEGRRT
jgi:phosphoribosylanthranilate isomerase